MSAKCNRLALKTPFCLTVCGVCPLTLAHCLLGGEGRVLAFGRSTPWCGTHSFARNTVTCEKLIRVWHESEALLEPWYSLLELEGRAVPVLTCASSLTSLLISLGHSQTVLWQLACISFCLAVKVCRCKLTYSTFQHE